MVLALTAAKSVAVALVRIVFVEYRLVAVSPVEEAFPKVVCPVTASVPLATKDEVAVTVPKVADPPVRLVISPVTEVRRLAKSDVEVALVVMISVKVFTPAND